MRLKHSLAFFSRSASDTPVTLKAASRTGSRDACCRGNGTAHSQGIANAQRTELDLGGELGDLGFDPGT